MDFCFRLPDAEDTTRALKSKVGAMIPNTTGSAKVRHREWCSARRPNASIGDESAKCETANIHRIGNAHRATADARLDVSLCAGA